MNKLIWLMAAMLAGDSEAVCATASKDMTFQINDGTTGRHLQIGGDRNDFCECVRKTTPLMAKVAASVHVTRDNMVIEH